MKLCVVCDRKIKDHTEDDLNGCWWNHCLLESENCKNCDDNNPIYKDDLCVICWHKKYEWSK